MQVQGNDFLYHFIHRNQVMGSNANYVSLNVESQKMNGGGVDYMGIKVKEFLIATQKIKHF